MKPAETFLKSLLFAGLMLSTTAQAAAGDPWIHPSYRSRVLLKEISNVANQTYADFPILVCLSNAAFLSGARPDGGDITFAGIDGRQFFHEIEALDVTNGNLTAWVCLPSFTNRSQVYLYYSNTSGLFPFTGSNGTLSVSTNLTNTRDRFLVTNTWNSNYEQVYHFGEDAGLFNDSTRFTNHALSVDVNIKYRSNGLTGAGIWTTGSNGRTGLRLPSASGFRNRTNTFTFWFSQGSPTPYDLNAPLIQQNSGTGAYIRLTNNSVKRSGYGVYPGGVVLSMNPEWIWHASFQFMGDTNLAPGVPTNYGMGYFTNGVPANTKNGTDADIAGANPTDPVYFMGSANSTGAYSGVPIGWADELRISRVVWSTNWLKCEYSNTVWARKGTAMDAPESCDLPFLALPGETTNTNMVLTFQWTPGNYPGALVGYSLGLMTNGIPCATIPAGTNTSLTTNLGPVLGPFSTNQVTWWVTASTTGATSHGSPSNSQVFLFRPRVSVTGALRDSMGNALAGALVRFSTPTNGYVFADSQGRFNLGSVYARLVQTLRITPRGVQGAEILVTNFLIADSDVDMDLMVPVSSGTTAASAVSRSTLVFPAGGEPLRVLLPDSWEPLGHLRVFLQSLTGGRKMSLWDGYSTPGNKNVEVPLGAVASTLSPGIYLMECRFSTQQMDASQERVIRQMVMVVR